MKQNFWSGLAALVGALLLAGAALAEITEHHEMKIMVMTDGDELIDADVSDLELGESRSFVTDSGKTVDILRTADGVDLFIDGELQELDFAFEGLHGEFKVLSQDIEFDCTSSEESECAHEFVYVTSDGDYEFEHGGEHEVTVIKKAITIDCEDGEDCANLHHDGQAHKVIRIKREVNSED